MAANTFGPLRPLRPLGGMAQDANFFPGDGGGGPAIGAGGGGGSGAGGGGGSGSGGPSFGVDLFPGAGGSPTATSATFSPSGCTAFNPLTWGSCIANQLLRFVLLILGILCVAGAIYLYKPTNEIIAAPVRRVAGALAETAE